MITSRRQKEMLSVFSVIVLALAGMLHVFTLFSSTAGGLGANHDMAQFTSPVNESSFTSSNNIITNTASPSSSSPLDDKIFFSSLLKEGKEFNLVPIQIQNNPPSDDEQQQNSIIVKDSICVVIRTYAGHGWKLQVMLSAWESIATSLDTNGERDLHIVLVNTDFRATDDENISFFYNALNAVIGKKTTTSSSNNLREDDDSTDDMSSLSKISYHMAVLPQDMIPDPGLFGYDVTQLALDELLNSKTINCGAFLFTNGDNYYHPDLLVQTGMNVPSAPMRPGLTGFDFVSHHKRPGREGRDARNQPIHAQFEGGLIDLGSVFVSAKAIRGCKGAEFRDLGDRKKNFMLDWHFFETLMNCGVETEVIHQILFIHQ